MTSGARDTARPSAHMVPRAARTPQDIVVALRATSRTPVPSIFRPGPARASRSGSLRPVPAQRPGIGDAPAAGQKREPPRRRGLSTGEGYKVSRRERRSLAPVK